MKDDCKFILHKQLSNSFHFLEIESFLLIVALRVLVQLELIVRRKHFDS